MILNLFGIFGDRIDTPRHPGAAPVDTLVGRVTAGNAARDRGDWTEAVVHYKAAVALSPRGDGIVVQLGHCLKESGQHDEAEACYRSFLDLHPDDADIHLQLGHLFLLQERAELAQTWYQKAKGLAAAGSSIADNASRGLENCAQAPLRARRKAALALTDARRFREAHRRLTVLVDDEGCEDLTGVLGNVCKEMGLFAEADLYYGRYEATASRQGPNEMFDAALQKGHLAKVRRDYSGAIGHFLRAKVLIATATRPSGSLYDLEAEMRACLGEITKAIELR